MLPVCFVFDEVGIARVGKQNGQLAVEGKKNGEEQLPEIHL